MNEHDVSFHAMGSDVRLIIGDPREGAPTAERAAESIREFVEEFESRLSRFRPESELCALNEDPRPAVPASRLLRDAVRSGLSAAERTAGLVDPTLLDELEAAGYTSSRDGQEPARLTDALVLAPERRSARPNPGSRWRTIVVDEPFGLIRRPPGVRIDTGGTGKGLAADLIAERLQGFSRFVVDCGGDLRVGGWAIEQDPFEVWVEHPLTREHNRTLVVDGGAVATSGLNIRVWRREDGRYAHHLLDPFTGEPAWTGLVGATALAPTALEAETLSKAALLTGPERARAVLATQGGLIVHEDGVTEAVGPVAVRPRYSITVPAAALAGDGAR